MATKTITIKESAYDILKSRKKSNESFSDVIERELGSSIWDIVGILSDEEAEQMREHIRESRKEADERMERIAERMRNAGRH